MRGHPAVQRVFFTMVSYLPHIKEHARKGCQILSCRDTFWEDKFHCSRIKIPLNILIKFDLYLKHGHWLPHGPVVRLTTSCQSPHFTKVTSCQSPSCIPTSCVLSCVNEVFNSSSSLLRFVSSLTFWLVVPPGSFFVCNEHLNHKKHCI